MKPGDSAEAFTAADDGAKPYVKRWPWWHTFANGRIYRPVMRLMHRFGWCYPEAGLVEPGHVWCHWCGMRGRRPVESIGKKRLNEGVGISPRYRP